MAAVVAFGVAGFGAAALVGLQPGASRTVPTAQSPASSRQAVHPPAELIEESRRAVLAASQTLQQAQQAKAVAAAAAVPTEAATELDEAIADLQAVVTATQAALPAARALEPAVPPAPVRPLAAVVAADPAQPTLIGTDTSMAPSQVADVGTSSPPASVGDQEDLLDAATSLVLTRADRVETLTVGLQAVTSQVQAVAAARVAEEEAAARKQEQRTSLDQYSNGQIPQSALCELDFAPGHQQRCDATEALEELNLAFSATFGASLEVTDSYRSYEAQVACRRKKGSLCATPGTSNHGTGIAVDFGGGASSFGTREHDWLLDHAGEYGWTLPSWARPSGSKPEPWHWEYTG